MDTALALSGGASQGSFEVGALKYLYSLGFFAEAISSASVGSVNALLLAQGGTPAAQRTAFAGLEAIWETELTRRADMCVEADWLTRLSRRTRQSIMTLTHGNVDWVQVGMTGVLFPPSAILGAVGLGADLGSAIDAVKRAQSLFTLAPTRDKIERQVNRDAIRRSGVELRMVAVALESGRIRSITQSGQVIERDGQVVRGSNPGACRVERNAWTQAEAAKVAAGRAVATAPYGERAEARAEYEAADRAAAHARDALDACLAAAPQELTVDIVDGALASSAIPCIFPPVVLGDETYVDGGIRWTLPLLTALEFGATNTIAVSTQVLGVQPDANSYKSANLIDIAQRSVFGLELGETMERHVQAARLLAEQNGQNVWVIQPRVIVHDGFTVDPGLIDINIAYGYMCAADITTAFPFPGLLQLEPPVRGPIHGPIHGGPAAAPPGPGFVDPSTPDHLAALADAIARCRMRCWELEHQVFGKEVIGFLSDLGLTEPPEVARVPDFDVLDELRTMKALLGILVEARTEANGAVPPGAARWADAWERHPWGPGDVPGPGNTPWSPFAGARGDWPGATRFNAMLAMDSTSPAVWLLNPDRHFVASAVLATMGGPGVVTMLPPGYLDALPRGADL